MTACSNHSQQILTPTKARQQLSGSNLLPPYIPRDKRVPRCETSDVISQDEQAQQARSRKTSAMGSLAGAQHPHFRRAPGEPLVRITKSSVGQNRSRLAQKSAGLLRGNAKNRLASMKSHKRSVKRASPDHAKMQTRFSVERMIKELGDH